MKRLNDRRVIMRVDVTPDAQKGLDDFCDRTGITKVAAVSRLIQWCEAQGSDVQAIVLGQVSQQLMPDVVETILKRMAGKK